jgi:hypothetical protein
MAKAPLLSWGRRVLAVTLTSLALASLARAQAPAPVQVEGQLLGQNVNPMLQALEFLGAPLPPDTARALNAASKERGAAKLQKLLDAHVLAAFASVPRPASRRRATRGRPRAGRLRAVRAQGGRRERRHRPPAHRQLASRVGLQRPVEEKAAGPVSKNHFLDVEVYTKPPMTETA